MNGFLIVGLSNNGLMNPTVWGIYVLALHSFKLDSSTTKKHNLSQ
jgi:hypothetical protein